MSSKFEYLKRIILLTLTDHPSLLESKHWYLMAFSIPLLQNDTNWEKQSILSLVTQVDGLYYIDLIEDKKQLIKITDYIKDQPLFSFQDLIDVDSSWHPMIKNKIQTKIGCLILNVNVLYSAFKDKFGYINESISMSKIKDRIATQVKSDNEAGPNDLKISEMIQCFDRLMFYTNIANIINIASTKKSITAPPGIKEKAEALFKEYEGQLSDPVKLVELENKLTELDTEYLKDDIPAQRIFTKKSKIARKKMFLLFGDTGDFIKSSQAKPIIPSLTTGISPDSEDFPKYMNDLRFGSFSRGSSTQLGGYTYKILQRSLSGLNILGEECDTKRGLKRTLSRSDALKIINRYILQNNKWKLIETKDEALRYEGKEVIIRSPMYCTASKNSICYKCMNEIYKNIPTGVTNIASELSSVILNLFLKLMHGTVIESTELQIKDLVT